MGSEKRFLELDNFYHVMTKSIAGYVIFRNDTDYQRMLEMMEFYNHDGLPIRFSYYHQFKNGKLFKKRVNLDEYDKLVDIIAYCLMPTHLHFLLTPLKENGISIYMKNLLNSYTRYFNTRNKRKGPLWQSRFKSVLVSTDGQLLHLTRYIHLNPTSSGIVENPEDWEFSSYKEFLGDDSGVCNFKSYLDIDPKTYKKFVESVKDYQRELSLIKHLALE